MGAPNINALNRSSILFQQSDIADSPIKMEAGQGKIANQIKNIALRLAAALTLTASAVLLITCSLTPLVGLGAVVGGALTYGLIHLIPNEAQQEKILVNDQVEKNMVGELAFKEIQEEIKSVQEKIELIDQQLANIQYVEETLEKEGTDPSHINRYNLIKNVPTLTEERKKLQSTLDSYNETAARRFGGMRPSQWKIISGFDPNNDDFEKFLNENGFKF